MGLDGGDRDFRQHERGPAHLTATGAAEGAARKRPQAGLEALSLIGDAAPERRRPVALNEIVAAVEQSSRASSKWRRAQAGVWSAARKPSPASIAATKPS